MIRWIGAGLIFGGCGSFGFAMAAAHRREERELVELLSALEYMSCELSYRQTDLPTLCRGAARGRGMAGDFFLALAQRLEQRTEPEVRTCVEDVLETLALSEGVRRVYAQLGSTLGAFDLPGQLRGLESAIRTCEGELRRIREGAAQRRRNYETLGLCAGAALAILFI